MTDTAASAVLRPPFPVLIAVIAGAFGLLYAYAVWNAVAFLVAQAAGPLGLGPLGWGLLLFAAAFPIAIFAAAVALGRSLGTARLTLLLLTGLALVAVLWLNVLAYASVSGTALLAG